MSEGVCEKKSVTVETNLMSFKLFVVRGISNSLIIFDVKIGFSQCIILYTIISIIFNYRRHSARTRLVYIFMTI